MARIQLKELRSFMELLEKIYSTDELEIADIIIKQDVNGGFVIQCKNIIKRIIVMDLNVCFNMTYEQLNDIMDAHFGEIDMEFEIFDNKDWYLEMKYKNKTIKVERNNSKFNFIYDVKFEINWFDLVNTIKNNNEFKIIKEGFGIREGVILELSKRDKENLCHFILAGGDSGITIKIKDDNILMFEKNDGSYFKTKVDILKYIGKEGF